MLYQTSNTNATNSSSSLTLRKIEENEHDDDYDNDDNFYYNSNKSDNLVSKTLESDIIADLKEIIDSVSANLGINAANNQVNQVDTSDDEEHVDDAGVYHGKDAYGNEYVHNSVNNNLVNLNHLKICIDDIEELNDKNNKTWYVFVIHVWNMIEPQQFNEDGECCTSWCVKR